MAKIFWSLLLAFVLVPGAPERAPAQGDIGRAAMGAGLGLAGGTAVTISTIVARARFQREYLDSAHDLVHWQSAPLIAAPTAGIVFGLAGDEALRASVYGSLAGLVVGGAVGAGLGYLLSPEQEWPWAGAVIGGGFGLAVGGLVYGALAWAGDPAPSLRFPEALRLGVSVPVP